MSSPANPADLDVSSIPSSSRSSKSDKPQNGFGTFGGVFTPCTLTILGVIMFRRFGYVVGNSGLLYALIILAAAKVITTLTTFSLSGDRDCLFPRSGDLGGDLRFGIHRSPASDAGWSGA